MLWKFRIAKIVLFQNLRWPTLIRMKWKALGLHGDLELLKWFHSAVQDGHQGSHLESLHITSAPEDKSDCT